jgi:hypothetical protein
MLALVASIFRRGFCPHGGRSKSLDHSSGTRGQTFRNGIWLLGQENRRVLPVATANREDFVGCGACFHRLFLADLEKNGVT